MAENLDRLLEQLEALATGPTVQSVEHLKELQRVFDALNNQDLSGYANAGNQMEVLARKTKNLEEGLKEASKAQKGVSSGAKNMSNSIMESAGQIAVGTGALAAFAIGLKTVDAAAGKLAGAGFTQMLKAAGVNLKKSGENASDIFLSTYDQVVVPLQRKQEDAFAGLLGGFRDAAGMIDEKTTAGRFVNSAEQAQVKADAMGRSIENTTNSFRFLKPGIEGAAQALEITGKIIEDLSDTLYTMGGGFAKVSTQNLMRFRNALNVTDVDMKKFGKLATATGTTASAQFMRVEQAATSISKATGINRKILATDLVKMRADFGMFGSFSTEALAKVAARAKSLGVEIGKLTQMATKFDDFDQAAESMATLSQTMGVNIDAFDLFQEEDPTKQLLMIRHAFEAAGQDITQMNRKQRRFIADSLAVDLDELFPALSPRAARGGELREKIDAVPETAVRGLADAIDKFNLSVPTQAQQYFEGMAGLMTTHRATFAELKKATAQNAILDKDTRESMTKATTGLVGVIDATNLALSGMPDLADSIKGDMGKLMKSTITNLDAERKEVIGGMFKVVDTATTSMKSFAMAGLASIMAHGPGEQRIAAAKLDAATNSMFTDASVAGGQAKGVARRAGQVAGSVARGVGQVGEIVINLTTNLDNEPIAQSVLRYFTNGQTVGDHIENSTHPNKAQAVNP